MNTGTGMNDGVNNPGIGVPGVNNPTAHSAGVGVNNVNNPAATQGTVNPAALHHQQQQQPGPTPPNPGAANNAAASNTIAGDPALGAQQPHAHGVPHGGTQMGGTGNEHTSTSRATGAGEKFGHKLKSAAAQGQGLGEMLRGNFNAAVDTAAGDNRGQERNERIAREGEDKINRAQATSHANQQKPAGY